MQNTKELWFLTLAAADLSKFYILTKVCLTFKGNVAPISHVMAKRTLEIATGQANKGFGIQAWQTSHAIPHYPESSR
jgi:hypothetical protein